MNSQVAYLLLTVLTTPAFAKQPTSAKIALYAHFERTLSAGVLAAIESEVHAILDPLGMALEWRDLRDATGTELSSQLAVVTFVGNCDVENRALLHLSPGPLGRTHITDGIILPFADVDCDAVYSFLQRDLLWYRASDRAMVFGRAVARVMVHELYHIFADTRQHGAGGLARETYSPQDLLSRVFRFQEKEWEALRPSRPETVAAEQTDRTISRR